MNSNIVLHEYDVDSRVTAFSTTRHGGCSFGNYASFNINQYCGDDEQENRQGTAHTVILAVQMLIQVHDESKRGPHGITGTFGQDLGNIEHLKSADK